MIKSPLIFAAAVTAAALAHATPAHAQLSQNGGPISWSAEHVEYFDDGRRVVMHGNVDVVQNDSRLRANELTLYFSQSTASQTSSSGLGSGDIERMVADGEVYYVRPAQSARGDHAVYEVSSDAVTFTGNVVVASTENVIRGNTMVLHISSRQTSIAPRQGGRVQGVFVPQHNNNTNAPANSAPSPAH